ncbi:biliverdin reductase A-like [Liolophura sinensis]|uniref:biliverdin reductase A-like n=1 Tax=Liolophura sinensis TaxID=3198878 RepID=UPI0031584D9A
MSSAIQSMYGVVVVGLGRSGKPRVRDLQKTFDNETLKRIQLKGFVSRRDVSEDGLSKLSLDEALSRDDVDIVIVATEPKMHEQYVRKVLEAGKHCLVDYPLALTSAAAKELYQLARTKGVSLHEENIGIMSKTSQYLREELKKRPPVTEVDMLLLGNYNGWIEDWESSGGPFVTGNGMLQTALSLFGPLEVDGASLQQEVDKYSAVGHLFMTEKRPLNLTLQRVKGEAQRRSEYVIKFEDGSVIDSFPDHILQPPKPGHVGLFMQDLIMFVDEIEGKRDPSENIARTIRSLELAQEIHSHVGL